jgi:hypothetical protein
MARLRFLAVALLALCLVGNPTQTGRSAGQSKITPNADPFTSTKTSVGDDGSRTIYALADMGYDSDLGKWIAQTIPEMIEPKSWQEQGGAGALRYYAPKNILIIKQTAAIQAKVDGFLKDLKKSLPKGSDGRSARGKKTSHSGIVPAAYQAPETLRTSSPVPEPSSYPVPAPVKQPKHLFHFLIRYEGDGIIDDNVVKFMKAYYQAEQGTAAAGKGSYAGNVSPSAGTPAVGVAPAPAAAGTSIPEENEPKEKEDKKDDEKGQPTKQTRC